MSYDLFSQPEAPRADELRAEARRLAVTGANLAADHADRTHDAWTQQATAFLLQFARQRPEFQASDVREAAEGKVPQAPDPRAWGAVVLACKRQGWIKPLGYAPTARRTSHGRQEMKWRLAA